MMNYKKLDHVSALNDPSKGTDVEKRDGSVDPIMMQVKFINDPNPLRVELGRDRVDLKTDGFQWHYVGVDPVKRLMEWLLDLYDKQACIKIVSPETGRVCFSRRFYLDICSEVSKLTRLLACLNWKEIRLEAQPFRGPTLSEHLDEVVAAAIETPDQGCLSRQEQEAPKAGNLCRARPSVAVE